MVQRPTNAVARFYHFLFTELSDPRTNDWPLIGSPVPGLLILGAYLYFVNSWGPRFMENRKPFRLNGLLIVYNFIQVVVSTWLFYEAMEGAWLFKYSWKCQPVDFSNTPEGLRVMYEELRSSLEERQFQVQTVAIRHSSTAVSSSTFLSHSHHIPKYRSSPSTLVLPFFSLSLLILCFHRPETLSFKHNSSTIPSNISMNQLNTVILKELGAKTEP